jgi:hypothetical protein
LIIEFSVFQDTTFPRESRVINFETLNSALINV